MTEGNIKPCSYSLLKDFDTCPRMCYYVNIVKTAKKQYSANKTQQQGKEFHKAIENALDFGDERLPRKFKQYQWVHDRAKKFYNNLSKLVKETPEIKSEQKLAVDDKFDEHQFYSSSGFYRGMLDFSIVADKLAYIADWKAGNPNYADPTQIHDQSTMLFSNYPRLQRIIAELVFIREPDMIVKRTYTREEIEDEKVDDCYENMRDDLSIRVVRFREMDFGSSQAWKPKQNGLCKAHCPVVACQYNGANDD